MYDKKELIKDCLNFYKVIGGAEELADRGWREDVWMHDGYTQTIDEVYAKYLPEESNDFVPITVDDYLSVEYRLCTFFEEALNKL